MSAETEDTVENTEEVTTASETETPAEQEDTEVAEQQDPLADVLEDVFGEVKGFQGVDTLESDDDEETETTEDESEDDEYEENENANAEYANEESDAEGDETDETDETLDETYIITTKVGETEKSWNLKDEKQRENLINRLQQLDHADAKFAEAKTLNEENTALLAQQQQYFNANAMRYLWGVMQGKAVLQRPIFDDYVGTTDTDEEDRTAFENADKKYLDTQKALIDYETGWKTSSKGFSEMVSEFSKAHPDVENPVEWVSEKIKPYYEALEGYGMKPFPTDTAEMLYWWTNKPKLEESIREDERRKLATKKTPTVPQTKKVSIAPKKRPSDPMSRLLDDAFGEVKGFKS